MPRTTTSASTPTARRSAVRICLALAGLTALVLLGPDTAQAQDPAATLDVSIHYLDVDAVLTANEVGLDARVTAALSDVTLEHGARLAIVDALGWRVAGSDHATRYLEHVAAAHDTHVRDLALDDLNAAEAMSLGLLLVRDQPAAEPRLELTTGALRGVDARALLAHAARKAPESYAVQLAAALVTATPRAGAPCEAHEALAGVVSGFDGARDLRAEADEDVRGLVQRLDESCTRAR